MHTVLAKVDEVLYDGDARSITVPSTGGELTILQEHMPLITTLKAGTVHVRTGDAQQSFEITGGVLEVTGDSATIIL